METQEEENKIVRRLYPAQSCRERAWIERGLSEFKKTLEPPVSAFLDLILEAASGNAKFKLDHSISYVRPGTDHKQAAGRVRGNEGLPHRPSPHRCRGKPGERPSFLFLFPVPFF